MGFTGNVLAGVEGIQWYYIAGILIFIGLFIVIVYRTYKIPKKDLIEFKTFILDKEDLQND